MSTLLLLLACSGGKPEDSSPSTETSNTLPADSDGDGVPDSADCSPDDPYAYPGAHEVPYDGVDQDCDGEDVTDVDGDGYVGVNGGGDDCNDNNPNTHPGASEICYNGQDDDCDGTAELANDCDADGYLVGNDCNDEDATIHPDAPDAWYDGVDTDCAGNDDYDQDVDGESWDGNGGPDCDDQDPITNTQADEVWDHADNNCDGNIDKMTTRTTYGSYFQSAASADLGFGSSFTPVGDVDGDGRPDVAIGANLTGDVGRVWLVPVDSGIVTQDSEALGRIDGDVGDYLGSSMLKLGDYLVVGAGDPSQGAYGFPTAFKLSDITGTIVESSGISLQINSGGQTLIPWQDIDGDGQPELVATIPGIVAEVDMITYANLRKGAADWVGSAGDSVVLSAGRVGDWDADGLDELGVQIQTKFGSRMSLVSGSDLQQLRAVDLGNAEAVATAVIFDHYAVLPDFNGDGYDETLLSSMTDQSTAGRVYLFSGNPGPDLAVAAFATITGASAGSGVWAEQLIDADNDGQDELLTCSPGADGAGLNGQCETVPLADLVAGGDHIPGVGSPYFTSVATNDLYGTDSFVQDFDADGDDDLWVTLPGTGSVVLYRQE